MRLLIVGLNYNQHLCVLLFHLIRFMHQFLVRTDVSIGRSLCSAAKLLSATNATTVVVWKVTISAVWTFVMFIAVRQQTWQLRISLRVFTFSAAFLHIPLQFFLTHYFPDSSCLSFQKSATKEEWLLLIRPSTRFVRFPRMSIQV